MTAAKILLDRVVPSLKPVDAPVVLNQAAELSSSGREVLQLLGDGQLGIDQAQRILRALGSQRDLIEFDDSRVFPIMNRVGQHKRRQKALDTPRIKAAKENF